MQNLTSPPPLMTPSISVTPEIANNAPPLLWTSKAISRQETDRCCGVAIRMMIENEIMQCI